jgi:tetratricopeptide (TPR) repeat protein
MRTLHLAVALLSPCLALAAQLAPPQLPTGQELQQLATGNHWSQIVLLLQPVTPRSAELDFYYGEALARLGRFADAQSAFEAGRRLAPADARFPVEMAGVAFKQRNYARTIRRLRQSLRLAPGDDYANDFLGTAYFLVGNLEASLKYWNHVGKPQIENVREDPEPRISPALLDSAFAFSPTAVLPLPQFLNSYARIRALGVFPQYRFDLNARSNGNFDVVFRGHELDGMGDSKLEATFLFFQGLPFQEVDPQLYNLHRQAINFDSTFRWDAQKRRIFVRFSGPFEGNAKYRWGLTTDLRDENWAIRDGFTGPAPVLADFNMRHEMAAFGLTSNEDRFTWTAGAELSHRNFRGLAPATGSGMAAGTVLTPQMLATGYELKPQAQISSAIWRVPERRFTVHAAASSEAARLWSRPQESFEKLTGSLGWHWFPQLKGDDYETSQRLRAGRTFGQPPFDELFILGLERDNDLPMHAHIGTRDGRKGSAPLGREYLLQNWELNKNLYSNGIVKLQLGPLFDIGKIADAGSGLGSHQWLFDTGAQAKLRVFGSGLVFSYGKDLRTGNNAFYVEFLQ